MKDEQQQAPPESQKRGDAGRTEFTPEQQARIDEIIAERVRRAEKTAVQKAKDEAEEAAKRAQMDEVERLKAEKADAEQRTKDAEARISRTLIEAEARVAAGAAGAKPERLTRILRLLDLEGVTVEDGAPDGKAITAAVGALKSEIPELFGGSAPAARSGAEIESGDSGRTWTRAQVAALSAEEYEAHREEILVATQQGRVRE